MDFNNLIGGVNNALMSPAALAGLGLLSGEGLSGAAQGVQAGTQALQAKELQRQAAIKAQRDQDWQNTFANGQTPDWAKGLPPSLVQTAAIMGPDQGSSLIGQGILHKGDLDANMKQAQAMANLEFANKMRLLRAQQQLKLQNFQMFQGQPGAPAAAQPSAPTMPMSPAPPIATGPATDGTGGGMNVPNLFSGPSAMPSQAAPMQAPQQSWLDSIPSPMNPRTVFAGVSSGLIPADAGKFALEGDQQKLGMRAQIAKQAGMDPNDPVTREYVMTGSYPKQEKNWPAIKEADDKVLQIDNTLAIANKALAENDQAYSQENVAPSWLARITGLAGEDRAAATQEFQNDTGQLALELAKSLGGTRPSAFSQKKESDLLGGLDKTRKARAANIQSRIDQLQRARELAMRQAGELRNGTYYAPRTFGGAQPSATPSLPDPLGIR